MAVSTPPAPAVARAAADPGAVPQPMAPGARHSALLLGALLAVCAYAAFAHGAVGIPEETRLQIGVTLLAGAAATAWLFGGTLRLQAPRAAWWAVGGLVALAAWSTLSLAWSVTPTRTWLEVNRTLLYALVVVLAIAAASGTPRALERLAVGYLAVAVAVATYALGGKVAPGLHLHPLFDLNHTRDVARLRAPLEYWNALALVCVLGVPIALRIATDATRRFRWRLAALAVLFELVVVIGMTYSRGGLVAVAAGVTVLTLLGGPRLRGLVVLGVAIVAAIPVFGVAFSTEGLKANSAPLDVRIADGRTLLAMFVLCLGGLMAAGWHLLKLERTVPWSRERDRQTWRALGAAVAAVALIGVLALAASDRGLTGSVSHAFSSFTEVKEDKQYDPVRLLSSNSGNRWVWWKEAVGAWSDRPVGGWGAGSFPVTHKLYRRNQLSVAQPHNVPLQFLAETGLVGFLLAYGSLGLLFAAAYARVRSLAQGRERDMAVALLAAATAWLAHGVFDWDWDIPGVTVPALVFLAALAARPSADRYQASVFRDVDREHAIPPGRIAALSGVVLLLAVYAASAVLPAWSDSKADGAQAAVTEDATDAELADAAAQAQVASRLDPLSARPLLAAATIAGRRGRQVDARRYLLQATDREPWNAEAWLRLAGIALELADRDGFEQASGKLLELDPLAGASRELAVRAQSFLTPPGDSATATGTPLVGGP